MTYLVIIGVCAALISVLNILFNPAFVWYVYPLATLFFIVVAVALDGLAAWLIRSMPEKLFDYRKKIFQTGRRKQAFLKAIRVRDWKDRVPELGMFTNFRKNRLSHPQDADYLARYILEACYGIVIHYVSVPVSLLIPLFDFGMYFGRSNLWLTVALPVTVVNAVLIVLPAFILEFNLPHLVRLYEYREKKKNRGAVPGEKDN